MTDKKKATRKILKKSDSKAAKISLINFEGKDAGFVEAPEMIFGVHASPKLITQYVRVFLAHQRQGNAHAKTRGEVVGSTRKIYRQKGTGRARHGAKSAPIFVGGGVAHGPKVRSFNLKLNKKQRRKALYYTLSLKRTSGNIGVIEGIASMKGKTVLAQKTFSTINAIRDHKLTLVYAQNEAQTGAIHPFLNLKNIELVNVRLLNAYNVVNSGYVLFTKEAYEDFLKFRHVQKIENH